PLTREHSEFAAAIEDHPLPPQEPQFVLWSTAVTPEHLETLGIPLLQGRRFTAADRRGAQPVVLISRATALRYWPDRNPIGRRLKRLREAPAGDDQGGLRGLCSEQDRANGNRGGRRGAGSAVDGMAVWRLCAARAGIGGGWDIRRGESRRASTNP